jgi:hypothetical protein
VPKSDKPDFIDWDAGREGYISTASAAKVYPAYSQTKPSGKPAAQSGLFSIRAEERFGSLVGAAGVIWGVYLATQNYASLWRFDLTSPGPLEVCALGILAWLHAKWRRSLKSG